MRSKFRNKSVTWKLVVAMLLLTGIVMLVLLIGFGGQMVKLMMRQDQTYTNIFSNAKELDREALLGQAEDALQAIVIVQAEATDERFKDIRETLEVVAEDAGSILADPDSYADSKNTVKELGEGEDGDYTTGYLVAGGGELSKEQKEELSYLSALDDIFKSARRYNEELAQVYYAAADGLYIKYTDRGTYDEDYDAREREWYQRAVESPGEVIWIETYVDYAGRLCITAAKAVKDASGQVAGVAGVDVEFSDLAEQIVADGLGDTGNSILLGDTYNLIAAKNMLDEDFDPSFEAHFDEPDTVKENLTDGDSSAFFAYMDGQCYYIASQKLTENSWIFCTAVKEEQILSSIEQLEAVTQNVVETEWKSILRMIDSFIRWDVIAVILLAALSVFAAYKVSRAVTLPIRRMSAIVSGIGAGDFDKKIPVESRDEVGAMARAFNRMQDNLKNFIESFRKVISENERIGSELGVATQIQADMLPRIFPPFPDKEEVDIYGTMNPAKEVGGDFYDFFLTDDNHLAFVIADVSGKGVPAALFMVISKTLIKNRATQGGTPAEILADVNDQLCEGNEADMFVTAWLGILDLQTGQIVAANAGHEYPAIRAADGTFTLMKEPHGLMLAAMEGVRYKNYDIQLEPGGGFFVYTDGVPEATDAQNRLYGTDRMLEALNLHKGASPITFMRDVRESTQAFVKTAPQFDDMTMVGLVWKGTEDHKVSKLILDANLEELPKLESFLEERLEAHGCPMDVQMQIQVAAEEIFVNIAHYAYPDSEGEAAVTLDFEGGNPETMVLTFLDEGVEFDPLKKEDPDVTLSAEERQIGGLGIFMVKKSMDEITYRYEDKKNILTIRKRLESKKK